MSTPYTTILHLLGSTPFPLIQAAEAGNTTEVRALLTQNNDNEDINQKGLGGVTALMAATRMGNVAVMEILLEHHADKTITRDDGATALMIAVQQRHTDAIKVLLKDTCQTNQVNMTTQEGVTALMLAAKGGQKLAVELLLQNDADPNLASRQGTTALFLAAKYGHTPVVTLLLKHKVVIDQLTQDTTALFIAAHEGQNNVVDLLLQNKANPNLTRSDGSTALMTAAQQHHDHIVEALLKNQTNVNQTTKNGTTALMLASMQGHLSTVQILFKYNANANITRLDDGATALMFADHHGHTQIAQLIREQLATYINGVQKKEIESMLSFHIRDITETFATIDDLPDAIKALWAMTSEHVNKADVEFFETKTVWESIAQVRAIFAHPCPQNRPQGLLDDELNIPVFYWADGTLQLEQKGILGLTARNDHTSPAITKEAVIKEIQDLIKIEINKLTAVHTYIFPANLDEETLKLLSQQGAKIIPSQNTQGMQVQMVSHRLDKQLRDKTGMHRVAIQQSSKATKQVEYLKANVPGITIELEVNPKPGEMARWLITASKTIFPQIEKVLNPRIAQSEQLTENEKIKQELKAIFIDIFLLQKTQEYIGFYHMRPAKFRDLSFEQAVEKHKSLLPRIRELAKQLSAEDFSEVDKAAKDAANTIIEANQNEFFSVADNPVVNLFRMQRK